MAANFMEKVPNVGGSCQPWLVVRVRHGAVQSQSVKYDAVAFFYVRLNRLGLWWQLASSRSRFGTRPQVCEPGMNSRVPMPGLR